ncbi:MAG: hypothetical protein ACLQPD_05870 [Desulfomonilaceae bacterium]
MAKSDDIEDLEKLIDRAVDTFFVEVSEEDERALQDAPDAKSPSILPKASPQSHVQQASLSRSDADSVTFESFSEGNISDSTGKMTSGDPETDRAIDLAVDTLFIEEPDSTTPETTEIELTETESVDGMLTDIDEKGIEEVFIEDISRGEIQSGLNARHQQSAVSTKRPIESLQQGMPLKKLQEAILTLEWEISPRSVKVLSKELTKLRAKFQDDVTVDFAALAMRLVLDYVMKRMSRAHPESIRFLLVVTGFLHRNAGSDEKDPLAAFHQILTRYENFKTVVRKAEGLPDRGKFSADDLEIKDPEAFSKMVEAQALNLVKAGKSLAKQLDRTRDSRNLIRSFRFLVTRSVNRIFENTHKKVISGARKGSGGSA